MKYISASDLEAFLKTNDRVYLCGNLEKKQEMDWISTDGVEIGIKHQKDTKIMFIKVPGGNDKIVIGDIGEQLTNWLSRW